MVINNPCLDLENDNIDLKAQRKVITILNSIKMKKNLKNMFSRNFLLHKKKLKKEMLYQWKKH